ncbi:DNA-binding protein [Candidatus Magnetoovum chiemensis]|nr:DNA-binding protein [Candidatus Magnetoovum chiemensis]
MIIEVKNKAELLKFIRFPIALYKNDKLYSPQLTYDLKTYFSNKNPFYSFSTVKLFMFLRETECVGRIALIINNRHLEFHKDSTGFFGFFECVDDLSVCAALLDRVREELKAAGLNNMRGPMNFSTNEECGFLINNFDAPPMIMTPYNKPYYPSFMESYGMIKSKDLYAYIVDVPDTFPDKVDRVANIALKRNNITVRNVSIKALKQELMLFKDIYNESWKDNWGFIALIDEELEALAAQLKPVIVPELMLIAENNGEPVGFLGLLPDFNYVLRKMRGSLNPITILKALYYSRKIKDIRLLLFGIKPQFRTKGVDALLIREIFKRTWKAGYKRSEFSWILEDNTPIQMIIKMVGGRLYKTYRIYEKKITG